jgi:phosphoribosylformylglycinamidine synthase
LALGTPFISGKDSLYNEYVHEGKSTAIPPTLLISAIGQVPDVRTCVTMDLKEPGNLLLLVGVTNLELGGSVWADAHGLRAGSRPPLVDLIRARATFRSVHQAISARLVRSCHDLSEGGLAAALAEMAFAGRLGVEASLQAALAHAESGASDLVFLFSESPTRFVLEVKPEDLAGVVSIFAKQGDVPLTRIGEVSSSGASARLRILGVAGNVVIDAGIDQLRAAWTHENLLSEGPNV